MDYLTLHRAKDFIVTKWPDARPKVSLICGSGWSSVADSFEIWGELPYEKIPGLGKPGVVGHAGSLVWGTLHGVESFIWKGRRHYYEGVGWTPIALPIFVSRECRIGTIVLTNSAGCIRSDLKPGDLMIISDHINSMCTNPLLGDHRPEWGPRFPDQSHVYTPKYRALLSEVGTEKSIALSEGVYLATSGPTYETPAEVRAYRTLGAEAVGMSTVPEAILASACGLEVIGLSCMTNFAAGISDRALSHEEVTETTRQNMPKMKAILEGLWEKLGTHVGL